MITEITGRHGSITDGLKQHALERLEQALKHAPELVSAHVILDAEKQRQFAEIIVLGPGLHATVHAESDDPYLSLDRCAEKLRHQLEKVLGKRKDRRRKGRDGEARVAAELAAVEEALARGEEPSAPAPPLPELIRATVSLSSMSAHEALALLPISDEGLVVFLDSSSKRTSILFQREDGSHVVLEAQPEKV